VACHVGIEASIVLLASRLDEVAELWRCDFVVGKHQVVADALVFLTAVKQVRKGCLVEFPTAACQRLCVVRSREVGFPLAGEVDEGIG